MHRGSLEEASSAAGLCVGTAGPGAHGRGPGWDSYLLAARRPPGQLGKPAGPLGMEVEPVATSGTHPDSYLGREKWQSTAGTLLAEDGSLWLPHKQRQPFPPGTLLANDICWLWLPLLSLQAADSVKGKMTMNLMFPFSFHVA